MVQRASSRRGFAIVRAAPVIAVGLCACAQIIGADEPAPLAGATSTTTTGSTTTGSTTGGGDPATTSSGGGQGGAPSTSSGGGQGGEAPTCTDGKQNGDETDVDCGGSCPHCLDASCMDDNECQSGCCLQFNGTLRCCLLNQTNGCGMPSCSDGCQDADESDIDCGGSCGSNCTIGKHCTMNEDCLSMFCDFNSGNICGVQ